MSKSDEHPPSDTWYIVPQASGECNIQTSQQLLAHSHSEERGLWGPFATQDEAIAKRIGLIRSGKCKPK